MVSYSRRPQSGQITCYLNRTYHVLLTSIYVGLVGNSLIEVSSRNPPRCRTHYTPNFYVCFRYLRRCVLERLLGVPDLVNFCRASSKCSRRKVRLQEHLFRHAHTSSSPAFFARHDNRQRSTADCTRYATSPPLRNHHRARPGESPRASCRRAATATYCLPSPKNIQATPGSSKRQVR